MSGGLQTTHEHVLFFPPNISVSSFRFELVEKIKSWSQLPLYIKFQIFIKWNI